MGVPVGAFLCYFLLFLAGEFVLTFPCPFPFHGSASLLVQGFGSLGDIIVGVASLDSGLGAATLRIYLGGLNCVWLLLL